MTTDLIGTTLGQYQIVALSDRDEVTTAYKAWQPSLERYVMLKVLAPRLSQDPELARRFLRGALTAARLVHPHMVRILDFGTEGGYSYVVAQFVEGATLEELIGSGATFTLPQATAIASDIASALDYAHERGIIHRGVKSANILIDGTGRAVLTGFGISEALIGSGTITKTGALIDAACYASPEMIRDQPLDHRSDLYSLGIVCYEMLAGEVPFRGDSPHTTFLAQLHAPPPPLPVPPPVEAVLHKMLAKRPEDRYDSAGEFARQLAQAARAQPAALPASPLPPEALPSRPRIEHTVDAPTAVFPPSQPSSPIGEPLPLVEEAVEEEASQAWKRRLDEAEGSLRFIREQKSHFAPHRNVPLQLIREERRLEQEIDMLKTRLAMAALRRWRDSRKRPAASTVAEPPGAAKGAEAIATEERPRRFQRFTDVRFPERCRVHRPVRLSVRLTVRPVRPEEVPPETLPPRPPERLSISPTPAEAGMRRVELDVFVSSAGFEVDRRHRRLAVPFDRDSEPVTFELIGRGLGRQIVELELFHGTVRVGYVVIETRVVEGDTRGQDAQVTYEAIDERVWSGGREQLTATLIATWREGAGLDYWILEGGAGLPVDGGSAALPGDAEAVMGFWADLGDLLAEAVQLHEPSPSELDSMWLNVQGLGRELGERLLSDELRGRASAWPPGSVVAVATNEKWIPWELIHDGDDFWGNKFTLARVPKIPGRGAFSASDGTVQRDPGITRLRKVVNVIGGRLGSADLITRVRALFVALAAGVSIEIAAVERATVAEVFRSVAGADLVHFTCHGYADPRPMLQLADDQSLTHSLTPVNLRGLPNLAGSVVFANACTSAAVGSFLGELRSFGWEFYKKGAAAYIGTLSLVPAEYAVAFAERFYERLLNGETVGQALHHAKAGAERESPFWLLYTLYGDPYVRKTRRT